MGVPSGVFSHPRAGRLRVVFSGQFSKNVSLGGDTDWRDNDFYILIRCYVGEEPDLQTAMLEPTCVLEMDYPGGSVEVPVGMEVVAYAIDGAGTVRFTNLSITCYLH